MPVSNTGPSTSNIQRRLETASSTSKTVAMTQASALIIALNNDRTVLYVTNTGNEWVTVDHKATAVFGEGIMLSPNGGVYIIESGNLDKRLLSGICATGKSSSLSVYEGTGEEVAQT